MIFIFAASIPITSAPILAMGSHSSPPPHPTSSILSPFRGLCSFGFLLNFWHICSFMYFSLMGLNLWSGLNFPFSSHHSFASLANFSISCLLRLVLLFMLHFSVIGLCYFLRD